MMIFEYFVPSRTDWPFTKALPYVCWTRDATIENISDKHRLSNVIAAFAVEQDAVDYCDDHNRASRDCGLVFVDN